MSVSGARCAVEGCLSTKKEPKNFFPKKNNELGKLWLEAINNPVLSNKSYEEIVRKGYFICRKHFSADSLRKVGRIALKEGAVPSLFLNPEEDVATLVEMPKLIQYVIVRSDLFKNMQWPLGAVLAQSCHACVAVIHNFYNDEYTQQYLSDLDNMHKVVLEIPDEGSLTDMHKKLEENNIDHKLWIEQPENIPTCLVTKPYPKEEVHKYVRKLKLLQ